MLTLDTVVIRNADVLSADVGAEIVLLHLDKNAYYDSDAIGAHIWQRLASGIQIRALCAELAGTYDVEPAVCDRDVIAFLEEALREGLISIVR